MNEKLFEEFDKEFARLTHNGETTWPILDEIKSFISTHYISKQSVREEILKLQAEERKVKFYEDWSAVTYNEKM